MAAVIGIGARDLEDFRAFGAEAVEQVAAAEVVIGLDAGEAVDLKGGDISIFIFDDAQATLLACCDRIKRAWEETKPESAELGHAAAGFWLFYWMAPDLSTIHQLAAQHRTVELHAAAADYIDSGFGAKPPKMDHPKELEARIPRHWSERAPA